MFFPLKNEKTKKNIVYLAHKFTDNFIANYMTLKKEVEILKIVQHYKLFFIPPYITKSSGF